ncbi:MAG TPA: RNA polymerase sigma factor [Patescibacteria group bacterium]|nr:RNA polymerase sigma factor [Patescibacteria group bacterium]
MQNEEALIERAQHGGRDALNELVTLHWQPLYRFVAYKIGSPEDAQEITQESFFRAFRSLPTYRQTGALFKTYLQHIALNLIRDFWRKQGRSPSLVELDEEQPLADDPNQPDLAAIRSEQRETIRQVLRQLPEEQRQTVELRIIAGLPVRETAIALGKSEAAVKMLQQRALKNLRDLLARQGISKADRIWR